MIRHVTTDREDRISDATGCARTFATPFVFSGLFCLVAAGLGAFGVETVWDRLGVGVLGVAHFGAGLVLWFGRSTRSVVRRRGVEWTERRPFRLPTRRTIVPSEVDRVSLEEGRDEEGDDVFRVALRLRSGERLPLTQQWTPSREVAEAAAQSVARRLEIPDRLG